MNVNQISVDSLPVLPVEIPVDHDLANGQVDLAGKLHLERPERPQVELARQSRLVDHSPSQIQLLSGWNLHCRPNPTKKVADRVDTSPTKQIAASRYGCELRNWLLHPLESDAVRLSICIGDSVRTCASKLNLTRLIR